MSTELVRKLRPFARLRGAEMLALQGLSAPVRTVAPHTALLQEGQAQGGGLMLVEGWAIRFRMVNGCRQIVRILIPGDLCDPLFFTPRQAIHSIGTITEARVASFDNETLLELFDQYPRIAAAFWWLAGHEQAVLQQRLVEIGRRNAYERTAYLIWELWQRLRLAGHEADGRFPFPVTQEQLGDALGITVVHMNRMLRQLRHQRFVEIRSRTLSVRDPEGLARLAGGSREVLMMDGPSEELRRRLA